jgi:hypothetical protein
MEYLTHVILVQVNYYIYKYITIQIFIQWIIPLRKCNSQAFTCQISNLISTTGSKSTWNFNLKIIHLL